MTEQISETIIREEIIMGTIVSKVPDLLKKNGWGPMVLVRQGLAVDTAYRLAKGDTNFSINVLEKLCKIFDIEHIEDIITFVKSDE